MSTPEPWLDSEAARVIGPVELVCAPTSGNWREPGVLLMSFGATLALALGFILVCLAAAGTIDALLLLPWLPLVVLVCCVLLLLGLALVRYDDLRERLLLGRRGLALWSPGPALVILWDDLGTIWQRVPTALDDGQPLSVVLERNGRQRLAITAFFAGHHRISLRVLEELARRTRTLGAETARLAAGSGAVTPAEHGLAEPGA
jgi:hypothetical protein